MSIKTLNPANTNSVGVQQGGLNSMQISLSLEHSYDTAIICYFCSLCNLRALGGKNINLGENYVYTD